MSRYCAVKQYFPTDPFCIFCVTGVWMEATNHFFLSYCLRKKCYPTDCEYRPVFVNFRQRSCYYPRPKKVGMTMHDYFAKPRLNNDQKRRLKILYGRNNYQGLIAISSNIAWISIAIALCTFTDYRLYLLSALIIGARQRAIASLLHEAAHGTLFKSKRLNTTIGRICCGWTILQSFDAYRTSHVLNHHPRIGDIQRDPDFQYMTDSGIYEAQTRLRFVVRFLLLPFLGFLRRATKVDPENETSI